MELYYTATVPLPPRRRADENDLPVAPIAAVRFRCFGRGHLPRVVRPAEATALAFTWGDEPSAVLVNATEPKAGLKGTAAVRLRLQFPPRRRTTSPIRRIVPQPVPSVPELKSISFQVKTNLPVSIKVSLSPYGFIYHGPTVGPSNQWQQVAIDSAYEELKKWCENGTRKPEGAVVSGVIVAVGATPGAKADVLIDDLVMEGPPGAAKAAADEVFRRRVRKVRVAPISWYGIGAIVPWVTCWKPSTKLARPGRT